MTLFSPSAKRPFSATPSRLWLREQSLMVFHQSQSVLQHLVFKMSFQDVLFTAPSPSPGGDEKVIFIFQRSPVNYSTGLCIAYSLHSACGYGNVE